MEWLSAKKNLGVGNTQGVSVNPAKQEPGNVSEEEKKNKLNLQSSEDGLVEFDFDMSLDDEDENQANTMSLMAVKSDALKGAETKQDTEANLTSLTDTALSAATQTDDSAGAMTSGDTLENIEPSVDTPVDSAPSTGILESNAPVQSGQESGDNLDIKNETKTDIEDKADIKTDDKQAESSDNKTADDKTTQVKNPAEHTAVDETKQADDTPQTFKGIITDAAKIREYFDSLTIAQKQAILKQVGSLDLINSLNVLDNGTAEFATKDGGKVTMRSTGECIKDLPAQSSTPVSSEQPKDTSGQHDETTVPDLSGQDAAVKNDTQVNTPQSQAPEQSSGGSGDVGNINPGTSNNGGVQTGGSVNQAGTSQNGQFKLDSVTGGTHTSGGTQGTLDSSNAQLKDLQDQQNAAKTDLDKNQADYDSTKNDMETDVSQVEGEISQGESDKTVADSELDSASNELSDAQGAADDAAGQVTAAEDYANQADRILNEALGRMQDAQGVSDAAAANNAQVANEQGQAQADATKAQQEENKAADETGKAKGKKAETKGAADGASKKTMASFKVKNQYQKEVQEAQEEYNSAQAEQDEDKGLIGKAVDAVKGFLSKLADAVSSAVDKLRGAEKQYEEDKADEEKKWALDEEAQAELEQKQEEQDRASEISKQAQIILDRKTGEKEVSDQEYADALLDLADAVMEQDEASGEYDSALEAVLEANENWQVKDGKVTDAKGEVVSCEDVCKELEKFVTDKIKEKSDTEASYDKVLKTTAGAIKGDKDKINSLGKQIKALEKDIKEQEKQIALEEQMAAQITAEKSALDAKKDSEGIADSMKRLFGFGNAKDEKSFEAKQKALQEAIRTGTTKNINEAYKAVFGDEVILDENGEPKLDKNGDPVKVSDLSDKEFKEYMKTETNKTLNAAKRIEKLDSGEFTYNGQTLGMDDIHTALDKQVEELIEEMENAVDSQGVISKFAGTVNMLFGFGTSEREAKAQVQQYKDMLQRLQNCNDASEYASLYKAITGTDFSREDIAKAVVYNEESGEKEYEKKKTKKDKTDLGQSVKGVKKALKEAGGDTELLSVTSNSKAKEAIYDYQNTQKVATDAVIGLTNAVVTTVAVAAAPVTGGASLAVAAGVNAASNVGLNAIDNFTSDSDGDGVWYNNYSLDEAGKDVIEGGIEGAAFVGGGMAAAKVGKAAGAVGGKIAAKTGITAASTAGKATFMQTVKQAGVNAAANAASDFAAGAMASGISYAGDAITNEDVDFELSTLGETMAVGGGIAAATGFAVRTAAGAVKGVTSKVAGSKKLAKNLEKALNSGTGKSGDDVTDVLLNKVKDDSSLVTKTVADDGSVVYSVSKKQAKSFKALQKNAHKSYNTLTNAGISESEALKILEKMPNSSTMLSSAKTLVKSTKILKNAGLSQSEALTMLDGLSASQQGKVANAIKDFKKLYNSGNLTGLSDEQFKQVLKNIKAKGVKYKPEGHKNVTSYISGKWYDGTDYSLSIHKDGTYTFRSKK